MSTASLPKSYAPGSVEPEITAKWHESRAFHADPFAPGEPYSIVIPPPNVTAALHLGHALNNTLQDVLVRAHRMGVGKKKYKVLWMPGTDHAGIATQAVVEKRLQLEGKKRTDFSREEFISLVQKWKDEYEATITEQLKSMGCSCDFERQRFTMDPVCAKAVREAFFRLFKDGLIYRGKRLVNWDPVSQTALADDEVEMEEIDGQFYYLRYPLVHPSTNPNDPLDCQEVTWSELAARGYPGAGAMEDDDVAWVTVATTRPETYLGDTAVAVNPKDPRARSLEGLYVQLPLVGRVIPIIQDDYVVMPDPESSDPKAKYATGFLKVTPAHDPNDWEIGMRHMLPVINVMAPDASISDKHGWTPEDVRDARMFVGKSREQARKLVVKEFERRGLLEATKPYRHSVGHSYRSHVPIEPYLSDQWYVKVTDDKLVGEAQRALSDEQFDGRKPERALTSRDRKGATFAGSGKGVSPVRKLSRADELHIHKRSLPHWQLGGSVYFVTFRLHHGELNEKEREIVANACRHWHGDRIELFIATVMPDHVHLLFKPLQKSDGSWHDLPALVQSIKSFTAHEMQQKRGETGTLWQDEYFDRIVRNEEEFFEKWNDIAENPVRKGLAQRAEMYPFTVRGEEISHGRDARATGRRADMYDGALEFFPARYAKMYQGWHEGLRDWCISRQLWWGHRIPVWTSRLKTADKTAAMEVLHSVNEIAVKRSVHNDIFAELLESGDQFEIRICSRTEEADAVIQEMQENPGLWDLSYGATAKKNDHVLNDSSLFGEVVQDPDVLDTWFSSALWPMSTMGWPSPSDWPNDIPEGEALLDTFNPTTVLLTAREIITLWVSRMVMFNRYFNDGKVPFRNVYIHAMIQDGHGQKMSKSLGNGVDPRDIIHSHGADAMRFTLVDMATGTQDVRLPVDIVCPHCGEVFHPKEVTASGGYRVAAPQLDCIKCGKAMVSAYGAATGEAKPSTDAPLARNTSSKFDLGRNFANKLWNAARFALSNLNSGTGVSPVRTGEETHTGETLVPLDRDRSKQALVDQWIINRLHSTLHKVEDAIRDYQFAAYAEAMYDFIWRDFCDWYLEAIKPTVKSNPAQQQVLRTVLNAALRLLHPIMPFVTEALWPSVQVAGTAGLLNVKLPPSELLATAQWPDIACKVHDKEADATFERVQTLVNVIRNVRGEHKVQPKQRLALFASTPVLNLIEHAEGVVEALGGLESVSPRNNGASTAAGATATFIFEGEEVLLTGLAGHVDSDAERGRLSKLVEEKSKAIASMKARLSNEAYVSKAPAHLVEETRSKLAEAEADLAQAKAALQSL